MVSIPLRVPAGAPASGWRNAREVSHGGRELTEHILAARWLYSCYSREPHGYFARFALLFSLLW